MTGTPRVSPGPPTGTAASRLLAPAQSHAQVEHALEVVDRLGLLDQPFLRQRLAGDALVEDSR